MREIILNNYAYILDLLVYVYGPMCIKLDSLVVQYKSS